ncbi:MAG: hypothetical protein ACXWLH_01625 [Candidatus Saccharimonadales bacterium]
MQPKPVNNKKIEASKEFHHKSNWLAYLIAAGLISLIMILISIDTPGALTTGTYLIALAAGATVFTLLEALTPKKKVIIDNGKLYYGKKSIDLNHLTDVSAHLRPYATRQFILNSYIIRLTDRAGKRIQLPLGSWTDQVDLLCIISGYASITGAVVNRQAEKICQAAKDNYS